MSVQNSKSAFGARGRYFEPCKSNRIAQSINAHRRVVIDGDMPERYRHTAHAGESAERRLDCPDREAGRHPGDIERGSHGDSSMRVYCQRANPYAPEPGGVHRTTTSICDPSITPVSAYVSDATRPSRVMKIVSCRTR